MCRCTEPSKATVWWNQNFVHISSSTRSEPAVCKKVAKHLSRCWLQTGSWYYLKAKTRHPTRVKSAWHIVRMTHSHPNVSYREVESDTRFFSWRRIWRRRKNTNNYRKRWFWARVPCIKTMLPTVEFRLITDHASAKIFIPKRWFFRHRRKNQISWRCAFFGFVGWVQIVRLGHLVIRW